MIAAAILALFVFDVAHAAPARLAVVESAATAPTLDVVLSIDADNAPTFQVFRGPLPGTWIVELPGVELAGAILARRAAGVLLGDTSVEPGIKGGTGRIVLSMHDDEVDFDAVTKKKSLQITFHHQGDKAALVAAHAARVVEQERVANLSRAKSAADAERARQAEQQRLTTEKLAAEQASLAALAKQQEQQRELARVAAVRAEAERARLVAQQKVADDEAKAAAAQKKLDDDNKAKAALAQKKLDDERAAEKARLAALEKKKLDDAIAQQRIADAAREAERVRLAAIEKKKIDDDKAAEAARVAAAAIEKQKALKAAADAAEKARIAAVQKKIDDDKAAAAAVAEKARVAALAQKKLDDDKAAAQARITAQKKIDDDKAAAEQARLAALATEKARVAALEQKRIDDAIEQQRAADAERARVAAVDAQRAKDAQEARIAEVQRRRDEAARPAVADDAGFGGKPTIAPTRPTIPPPVTTTMQPRAAPVADSFGGLEGGRTVELSRGGNRYERVNLPKDKGDDWGNDDDDDNAIDEGEGRSVLSQVTVQRSAGGARVGVRVDGGARYHVARRGRDRLVLTLIDTRANSLDVRRVLDARDLGGTVLRVMPTVEEDRRFRIELVVETRGQAPVRIEQDGSMLWLEVLG